METICEHNFQMAFTSELCQYKARTTQEFECIVSSGHCSFFHGFAVSPTWFLINCKQDVLWFSFKYWFSSRLSFMKASFVEFTSYSCPVSRFSHMACILLWLFQDIQGLLAFFFSEKHLSCSLHLSRRRTILWLAMLY